MIFNFKKFKNSNFEAGFLRHFKKDMDDHDTYLIDSKFVAPRKIDNRDLCLMPEDQGNDPYCSAHAAAGYAEVINWKIKHYPEKLDVRTIYDKAKEIDGAPDIEGTSLICAAEAIIQLGLFTGTPKYVSPSIQNIMYSIHTHSVCMGAFIATNEWNKINRSTGEISDLGLNCQSIGNHGILMCGYDNNGVYIKNNWGSSWGIYGFALIPWIKVKMYFLYGVLITDYQIK